MGSKQMATRLRQREFLEEQIKARSSLLKSSGKDPQKDPVLKKLKADLRAINRRIEAITSIKATYESVRAQKEEKKKEKKKQAEAPEIEEAGPSKRQQKKETKKQERVKKAIEKKQMTGQA